MYLTGSGGNVALLVLLGEINHVGREEGLAVLLEVRLVGIEHAIEPREQLLRAVVGVQHDGDAVDRRNGADVVGGGDGTGDRGLLVLVVDALAWEGVLVLCSWNWPPVAVRAAELRIWGNWLNCAGMKGEGK